MDPIDIGGTFIFYNLEGKKPKLMHMGTFKDFEEKIANPPSCVAMFSIEALCRCAEYDDIDEIALAIGNADMPISAARRVLKDYKNSRFYRSQT